MNIQYVICIIMLKSRLSQLRHKAWAHTQENPLVQQDALIDTWPLSSSSSYLMVREPAFATESNIRQPQMPCFECVGKSYRTSLCCKSPPLSSPPHAQNPCSFVSLPKVLLKSASQNFLCVPALGPLLRHDGRGAFTQGPG